MKKFEKSLDPNFNDLADWKLVNIANSNKIGISRLRSKIFHIKTGAGQIAKILFETQSACILGVCHEFRINKLFKTSIAIQCSSKNCKAKATLVFDPEYIIIQDGQFDSEMNSDEKLNNCSNFRQIRSVLSMNHRL